MPTKPSARLTVLHALKQSKGMTARELAVALGVSAVAARKHLDGLQQEGLVTVALQRRPMGRPSYVYLLTPEASSAFPEQYRQMLLDLLEDLQSSDGEHKVKRLLSVRAERQREGYQRRLGALPPEERVRQLARLRNEDGFMTALEEEEAAFILRQYNCPIQEVSRRFRQACGCEIELLRELLGVKHIERTETLANGDAACTYRIPKSGEREHEPGGRPSV